MGGGADHTVVAHDHRLHEESAVVGTDGRDMSSRVQAGARANGDQIGGPRHLKHRQATDAHIGANRRAEQTQVDSAHQRRREEESPWPAQIKYTRREPPAQIVPSPQLVAACYAAAEDDPFECDANERQQGRREDGEDGNVRDDEGGGEAFGGGVIRVTEEMTRQHEDEHERRKLQHDDRRMDENCGQRLNEERPEPGRADGLWLQWV